MKKVVVVIAIVLIVALGVGLLGYFTEGYRKWTFKEKLPKLSVSSEIDNVVVPKNDDILNIETESNEHFTFTLSDYDGLKMASPNGLTALANKGISAIVTPSSAVNKNVDWSVAWQNPDSEFATGKDVREYINVIPTSDGSLNAVVECYQAFRGETILVVCTTRDGGFTASCSVTFLGLPTGLSLDLSSLSYIDDGASPLYTLNTYTNYDFSFGLTNVFNSVDPDYTASYSVSVIGFGTCNVGDYYYDSSDTRWFWVNQHTKSVDSMSPVITVTVVNNYLHIVVGSRIEDSYASYYTGTDASNLWTGASKGYTDKVKSIADGVTYIGYSVALTEQNSGYTKFFKVRILSGVQNAAVTPTAMVF